MIREAVIEDALKIVDLASHASETMGLGEADRQSCFEDVLHHIHHDGAQIFVAKQDEEIIGAIGVTLVPCRISSNLTGMKTAWYVREEDRGIGVKLLKAAEDWFYSQGARSMIVSAMDGKVAKFLKNSGFEIKEIFYEKKIGG